MQYSIHICRTGISVCVWIIVVVCVTDEQADRQTYKWMDRRADEHGQLNSNVDAEMMMQNTWFGQN